MRAVNFLSLLEAKRDGQVLNPEALLWFVRAVTKGELPDYQVSAFLMAIYFRGLTPEETRALTLAMRDSGEKLEFPPDPRPLVDKHSTGGVGDKVSLVLAPLLACLGFRVPMVSGRGLGITGGTLDKLDSVPGFQSSLSRERIIEIVQECGCVICSQTESMVPADRRLYALRDVTGTVPSVPLIVASILSKKLAENLQALVLDVKFGRAAFMHRHENAMELARQMVGLGRAAGVATTALLTRMDVPLGRSAGNWLEVRESAECLAGRGPADLVELVIECAARLLLATRKADSLEQARTAAREELHRGHPARKFRQMLAAQGADLEAFEARLAASETAAAVVEVRAERSGFVCDCDGKALGELVRDLGGGRLQKDSPLDYHAGVDCLAKPGQQVATGDLLGRVHARDNRLAEAMRARLANAINIGDEPPAPCRLIAGSI